MAERKFSELTAAAVLTDADILAISQIDSATASLMSKRTTLIAIANKLASLTNYTSELATQDKTLTGAINELKGLISLIPHFGIEVVQTLPTEDISETTIYMTPSQNPQTQDAYDEFIYVNDAWEHVGSTAVDLSAYYTKLETDALLATKANTADVSAALALKENTADMEDDVTDIVVDLTDTQETAEGNPVTLQTVQEGYAKAVTIKLTPKQDLHGYDKPWPGGAGKNKADDNVTFQDPSDTAFSNTTKRTFGSKTYFYGLAVNNYFRKANVTDVTYENGVFKYTVTSSGYSLGIPLTGLTVGQTYTASATLNANAMFRGFAFYAQDGTWLTGTNAATFTIPSDTYYTCLLFSTSAENTECTVSNIQLEEGSTATAYEPYANICPIEGYEEASVMRTGVNQWDEQWEVGSISGTTGQNIINENMFRSTNYIPIVAGQNLYFKQGTDTIGLRFYDINKSYISPYELAGNSGVLTYGTNKLPTNTAFMRFVNTSRNSYQNNISVNYPATATAYEPYDGATATAEFPETIYGATGDAAGGEWGKTYPKIDLGTLTYTHTSSATSGKSRFLARITGIKRNTSTETVPHILCDQLEAITPTQAFNNNDGVTVSATDDLLILYVDKYASGNDADFKTAMSGVELAYELATPEPFQTAPAPLTLRKGDNTITTDGDSVKVKYNKLALPDIGGIGRYISALEAMVAALEGNGNRSLSLMKSAPIETKEETEEPTETKEAEPTETEETKNEK